MKTYKLLVAVLVFFMPAIVFADPIVADIAPLTADLAAAVADPAAVVTVFGIQLGGMVGSIILTALSLIGLASALVKVLVPVTQWTETKFDDEWLLKITKWLSVITGFLDKYVALNPTKSKARND